MRWTGSWLRRAEAIGRILLVGPLLTGATLRPVLTDPVGPVVDAADHPLVAEAARVAAILRADAEQVDREGITRTRLDLVAGAGLVTAGTPTELGGGGESKAVVREIVERIAAACGTTWFVLTQHLSLIHI